MNGVTRPQYSSNPDFLIMLHCAACCVFLVLHFWTSVSFCISKFDISQIALNAWVLRQEIERLLPSGYLSSVLTLAVQLTTSTPSALDPCWPPHPLFRKLERTKTVRSTPTPISQHQCTVKCVTSNTKTIPSEQFYECYLDRPCWWHVKHLCYRVCHYFASRECDLF